MVSSGIKWGLRLMVSIFFLEVQVAHSQIIWSDNFSDSTIDHPKLWLSDTVDWTINSDHELQLNAINSSPVFLTARSEVSLAAFWEFTIRLEFSPSSSNFAEVYLISDEIDPILADEAYFVRIGGISGSADDVSLYKKTKGLSSQLIDGRDSLAGGSSVELMIRVERDSNHIWSLYSRILSETEFILEGTVLDSSIKQSIYFSLWCKFTSSRSDKFFFDSIRLSGFKYIDTEAIECEELEVIDGNNLELRLSEIPNMSTAMNLGNYRVGNTHPTSIFLIPGDSSSFQLRFQDTFQMGVVHELLVENIADKAGNVMQRESLDFFFFELSEAEENDVLISEFMANPTPTYGLPELEYVELYNRSDKFIDLNSWSILDANSGGFLSSYILFPNEYLILCDQKDTSAFQPYGATLGINGFPALNNSSDEIKIQNAKRELIHKVQYSSSWHSSEVKSKGGYSLELINPFKKCLNYQNYASSIHPFGGTPGASNSTFDFGADILGPELIGFEFLNKSSIFIEFNELIDSGSLNSNKLVLDGQTPSSISFLNNSTSVIAVFDDEISSGSFINFSMQLIKDCEGNFSEHIEKEVILTINPERGDILINEILFNPKIGGSDYIELLNTSNSIFHLDSLLIGNDKNSIERIQSDSILFFPGEMMVLTEDLNYLMNWFAICSEHLIIENDLPSLNDDEGKLIIMNADSSILDQLYYNEEMHFPLIDDVEGVSLERIDKAQASVHSNFHSAAESIGFGSPTCLNSQFSERNTTQSIFSLRNEVFSPDQDGYEDVLFVDFSLKEEGYVGTVSVLDDMGRQVIKLMNNQLLAKEGSLNWDGLDENSRRSKLGIYILLIELFHPNGDIRQEKIPFVLAGKLE